MGWFWMFTKELTSFIRDKMSLVTFLLIPLLLIGILGASLSNAFGTGGGEISIAPMKIYVENEDKGPMGAYLRDQVLTTKQVADAVLLVETKEHAEAILIIPENFTELGWSTRNEPIPIRFITDNPSRIGVKVIESVVETFLRQTKLFYIMSSQLNLSIASDNLSIEQQLIGKFQLDEQVLAASIPVIREQSVGGSDRVVVSSFAYYSVGMGVMYMLFLGVTATRAFMIEVQQKTFHRLVATPQSMTALISGKFSGWLLLGILQFTTLVIGTMLLYGADWGDSILQLSVIIVAYSFAVMALAYFLATVFQRAETADQFGTIAVLIMAVVGGSMAPIYSLPDALNQAAKVLPNAWALQTIIDVMTGTDWSQVLLAVTVLIGMGLILMAVATLKLQQLWKG